MARSSFVQLDLEDRRRLYRLRAANTPVPEIARLMGRHRSTIYQFAYSREGRALELAPAP